MQDKIFRFLAGSNFWARPSLQKLPTVTPYRSAVQQLSTVGNSQIRERKGWNQSILKSVQV